MASDLVTTAGAEVKARRAARRVTAVKAAGFLVPVLSVAAALGLWELISQTGAISERDLPAMSTVVRELWHMVSTNTGAPSLSGGTSDYWQDLGYTVRGWGLGLAIAAGLAIPIGIGLGTSELAAAAFRVPIEFLRPIPSAVLIPLLYLTIGINLKSELFLAAFGAFWPLLVQTMYGVRDVDPVTVDTARSFGLGRLERLYRVTLPSSVPYIATGLRISSSVALILAFTAELFMGTPGLGQELNNAQNAGATGELFAIALTAGFLGLAIHLLVTRLERRALRWHPSQRVAEAAA